MRVCQFAEGRVEMTTSSLINAGVMSEEMVEDRVLVFLLLKADVEDPMESGVVMDPEVWSRLPGTVLEEVVRRLTISAHFRFRAVSKNWEALLSSPGFLRRTTAFCYPPRSLCVCGSRSSLSKDAVSPSNVHKLLLPYSASLYPCCAGGGLICFRSTVSSFMLHVCNPLLRTWRELPENVTPYGCVTRTTLVVHQDTGTYRIMVICRKEGESEWAICMYESAQDAWETVVLEECQGMNFAHVFCNGIIYCIDASLTVWSHNIAEGVSRQLPVSRPNNLFRRHFSLEEHCGSVLLVGVLDDSVTSYSIWKLDESQGAWLQMAVLHNHQIVDLFMPSAERDRCWNTVSLGNSFFLHIWINVPRTRSKGMLVYNFEENMWLAWAIDFYEKSTSLRFFYPCLPRLDHIP